jgi:hypothetical protein
MQTTPGRTLALAGLASMLVLGCSSSTGSNGAGNAATSTPLSAAKNVSTGQDGGPAPSSGPLRCAPSPVMLDACFGKAVGDACSLTGRWDAGFSFPGSCRSTLDGTGVACVPNLPPPPSFLVDACSGKSSGAACAATGPAGHTFEGACKSAGGSGTLFCGKSHTPPAAVVEACSGKSAGDACLRPEHRDGGSKPGVCSAGRAGTEPLACRPASSPGVAACTGMDAGAVCTLGFGHHGHEGPSGSCVVPAAGGPASCLVSCTELFRHHHHRPHDGPGSWGGRGGPHRPWWKHASDGGTAAP